MAKKGKSQSELDGALLSAVKLAAMEDPVTMARSGFLNVASTLRVSESGDFMPSDDASFSTPMRYTATQARLDQYCKEREKKRLPIDVKILKSRREGTSTYVQSRAICKATVWDGFGILVTAHKPRSAEVIFKIGSKMFKNLPGFIDTPGNLERDSRYEIRFKNSLFGVSESWMKCLSANPESIESGHGDQCDMIHASEASRYPDPDVFSESISPLVRVSPRSERWFETTGNGEDPMFYPRFQRDWKMQGGCNFWERGFREDGAQGLAYFAPWYECSGPKHIKLGRADVYEELLDDLEEYELWLMGKMGDMWEGRGCSQGVATIRALEQIFWRRCMLPSVYAETSRVPLVATSQDAYRSVAVFQRQEPATVNEAFSVSAGNLVASPEDIIHMGANVRDPDMRCMFTSDKVPDTQAACTIRSQDGHQTRLGWSFWDDFEKWSEHLLLVTDFAMGRSHSDPDDVRWDRDFTHSVLLDVGRQYIEGSAKIYLVGEFLSQSMASDAAIQIGRGKSWIQNRVTNGVPPYEMFERPHSSFRKKLILESRVTTDRVFYHTDLGRRVDTDDEMGFQPSLHSNEARIDAMLKLLNSRRFVNRSDMLAGQITWFEDKGNQKYGAKFKGKSGRQSIDDGILALATGAYGLEVIPSEVFMPMKHEEQIAQYMTEEYVKTMDAENMGLYYDIVSNLQANGYGNLGELMGNNSKEIFV